VFPSDLGYLSQDPAVFVFFFLCISGGYRWSAFSYFPYYSIFPCPPTFSLYPFLPPMPSARTLFLIRAEENYSQVLGPKTLVCLQRMQGPPFAFTL